MSTPLIPETERRELLIACMEYAAARNRLELHGPDDDLDLDAAFQRASERLIQASQSFCDKLKTVEAAAASGPRLAGAVDGAGLTGEGAVGTSRSAATPDTDVIE